jgi:DNA-binding GntR family transcriptional regulator
LWAGRASLLTTVDNGNSFVDEIMRRRETLPVRVVQRLSNLIVSDRLRPGTRLVETDLARRLRVSRAPIREAVKEREPLGLATKRARRGARVVELSAVDVKEIYEITAMLDGLAARLAAERTTDTELRGLRAIHEQTRRAVGRGDRHTYATASRRFHEALIAASGNSRLIRLYDRVSLQIWWLGNMVMTGSDRHRTSVREHGDILEALATRDAKRAQEMMEEHGRRGGAFFFDQFPLGKGRSGAEAIAVAAAATEWAST